ncbi:12477_t:CDS:10 [Ambispora gerdemannii]|uniref:12477_t:CDS:1 n=1 Tax=Ambispora gerdemannii TaxID=144530 RepID=A0A9N8ZC47_9GLOM|nr:12477_t:CDS:10 [Ambispora gerdemannii]
MEEQTVHQHFCLVTFCVVIRPVQPGLNNDSLNNFEEDWENVELTKELRQNAFIILAQNVKLSPANNSAKRPLRYIGDEIEIRIDPELTINTPLHIIITHAEATFYANNGKQSYWAPVGDYDLRPKGRGSSIMIFEFLCETRGRLMLNNEEKYLNNVLPDGHADKLEFTEACVIIEVGKIKMDGRQSKMLLNNSRDEQFLFSKNTAWSQTNLLIRQLNGAQARLRNSQMHNGTIQSMILLDGRQKGIKIALEEQADNRCTSRILLFEPDFATQKPLIQEIIERHVHVVLHRNQSRELNVGNSRVIHGTRGVVITNKRKELVTLVIQVNKALVNLELLNKIKLILQNSPNVDTIDKNTQDWTKKRFYLEEVIPAIMKIDPGKWGWIRQEIVEKFINNCTICAVRKSSFHPLAAKPIIAQNFLSRLQMNLIDLSFNADGDYKYICHIRDHFSRFSWAKPLTSKRAVEVATYLFDLFHSLSLVEHVNGILQQKLGKWKENTGQSDWSFGIRFVISSMNNSYCHSHNKTPYELVYGDKPHGSCMLINELFLKNIRDEENIPDTKKIQNSESLVKVSRLILKKCWDRNLALLTFFIALVNLNLWALLTFHIIPSSKISIREAARLQSVGPSCAICSCKSDCNNNRCCCKKSGGKCGSRCHDGHSCQNKE